MDDITISNHTIIFDNDFNESITIEMIKFMKIPKNNILKFGKKFNKKIEGNLIEGIKKIFFGDDFNQSIDNLPTTLKILILGNNFNQSVDNLPKKLNSLIILNLNFNQSVDNLPSNLIHLLLIPSEEYIPEQIITDDNNYNNYDNYLSYLNFNKTCLYDNCIINLSINNLPIGLKSLILLNKFNNSLDNLSNTLELLIVGNYFDLSFDYLPNSLKILGFGNKFNGSLNNLPSSIEILIIGSKLSNKIEIFPYNLKKIIFNDDYIHELTNLDPNIEITLLNKNIIQIPNGHKKLVLNSYNFFQKINYKIPNDIEEITLYNVNDLNYLPINLKIINIKSYYNINIIKLLPKKLTKIIFDKSVNYNIKIEPGDLPKTLEVLELPFNFNKIIDKNNLPNNLKSLKLSYSYTKPIQNLPDSIEYLHLQGDSKILNLPVNLKQIILNSEYKYLFSFGLYNLFSKFKIILE